MPPVYLRPGEVAKLLHCSTATVHRWSQEGKLPFLQTLGGHRRYPADKINALVEELTHRPKEAPDAGRG